MTAARSARPRSARASSVALLLVAIGVLGSWGCSGVGGASGLDAGSAAGAPTQLLVTLRPESERDWQRTARELSLREAVRVSSSWFMRSLGEQCLVLELPPGRDAEAIVRRLAGHARVASVELAQRFRLLVEGADPYSSLQAAVAPLRLDRAHRHATGRGVAVAIVDTGLDLEHPDLVGRIRRAHDFVGRERGAFLAEFHGTAVAGVVAARAGNGVGGLGVAPEADLWALRACWQEPGDAQTAVCDSYTLAQALDLAIVERARVINLSLAGEHDLLLERLIRVALERGAVVVAAAQGVPPGFPASIPGVLAVHSWQGDRPRATFEGELPPTALAAPGVDILTTVPGGGFDFVSGSSFAAAQASGVVALLLERLPTLGPDEVVRVLHASAVSISGSEGPRLLDACAALSAALDRELCGE